MRSGILCTFFFRFCLSASLSRRCLPGFRLRCDALVFSCAAVAASVYDSLRLFYPYRSGFRPSSENKGDFPFSVRSVHVRILCFSAWALLRLSHGSKSHFRSLYRSEDQPPGSAVSPHLYQPCQSCIHQFLSDTYLYERAVPRFQDLWNSAGFRMAHDDCYASGVLQGKYSVGNIRHKKRESFLRMTLMPVCS